MAEYALKSVSESDVTHIGLQVRSKQEKKRAAVKEGTYSAYSGLLDWTRNGTGKLCSDSRSSVQRADLRRLILITFFVPERSVIRRVRASSGNLLQRGFP
jgi:hypothetical protein